MIFIARRKAVVACLFLMIALFALILSGQHKVSVFSGKLTRCIVIDAGHGALSLYFKTSIEH